MIMGKAAARLHRVVEEFGKPQERGQYRLVRAARHEAALARMVEDGARSVFFDLEKKLPRRCRRRI